jgi:hypothetical protein
MTNSLTCFSFWFVSEDALAKMFERELRLQQAATLSQVLIFDGIFFTDLFHDDVHSISFGFN